MIQVILVIHLILAVSIIGLILVQRSEGGGIGLGTGGGLGSFATPQATASALTKTTWYCVAGFFTTSLVLGILYNQASSRSSILDQLDHPAAAIGAPVSAPAGTATDVKTDVKEDKAAGKKAADKKMPAKTETRKPEPSVPVTP